MEQPRWHSLSMPSLLSALQTSESGLSGEEAERRLARDGKNSFAGVEKEPWYALLLAQFRSLPIIMLLVAAAISAGLAYTVDERKYLDAAAIFAAVLFAVFFSFFQEYKAEKALDALKRMVVQRSVVVRGGRETSIDSSGIVAGDIVVLDEGSRVPADMRLLEAANLAADQSTLTGESRPSDKSVCALMPKTALSEQRNMLFAGTTVVRGHCRGVVVATGMKTEFGKIVGIVAETKETETPLQASIADLSRTLGFGGIVFATIFFIISILRGESAIHMFVVAVTLAVAVIPEGLPTVLAITLAIGVQKMARRNAIVRKMAAVETLGSATVICTDKTGTITQNQMVVQEIVLAEKAYSIGQGPLPRGALSRDSALSRAAEIMALCSTAMRVESDGESVMCGDPTEVALLRAVSACGASESSLRMEHRAVGEVPFESGRKMMSSIRLYGSKRLALVKGAPEKVIPRCTSVLIEGKPKPIAQKMARRFSSQAQQLGQDGMRVLALAYRPIAELPSYSSANTERSLVLVGLVAMEDPARPEVPQAIASCKSAGIRVIMLTGDSLHTAMAIASRVGLLGNGQRAVDGQRLEEMDDAGLARALSSAGLFARVTPEQKYRITKFLMESGEIVAVTGDGVNDAPALKRANIGVAMGIAGTDVSKEVADIVLTDDNFASIVNAVRYGRTIFANIKSFVRYQLTTNVAALLFMFLAPAFGLPLPLLPLQILWINIIMDGPPALALGAEPPAKDVMQKPPRNPSASFLSKNLIASILFLGTVMAAVSLCVFAFYVVAFEPYRAYTTAFTLFVFLQFFNALNCRSSHASVLSRPFSNPYLYFAIVICMGLQAAIIYYPPLQGIFGTVPLEPPDWGFILAAASLIVILEELKKKHLPQFTVY